MRLIRLKVDPKVTEYLTMLTKKYALGDPGIAVDIFAMLRMKNAGIPTQERTEKIIDAIAQAKQLSRITVSIAVKKRRQLLQTLASSSYFVSVIKDPASAKDPIHAVERVVSTFKSIAAKLRQAQCKSCSYLANCQFGTKYADIVTDITKVIDRDYDALVHKDCPERPTMDFVNAVAEGNEFFSKLSDKESELAQVANVNPETQVSKVSSELRKAALSQDAEAMLPGMGSDMDNSPDVGYNKSTDDFEDADDFLPPSLGGSTMGTHSEERLTGGHYAKVCEQAVKAIAESDLVLFELGRKLGYLMEQHAHGKFKPSPELGNKKDIATITSTSDVVKAVPSEFAHDDAEMDTRIAKRTLLKKQELNPEDRKPLLYLLIDVSGSMACSMNLTVNHKGQPVAFASRLQVAKTFCLSVIQNVQKDGGMVYLRTFSGRAGKLYSAKQASEYDALRLTLNLVTTGGGGTSIPNVLKTAMDDIYTASGELSKAEILLITDCEDTMTSGSVKQSLSRWKSNILHTLQIGSNVYGNASKVLRQESAKFIYVDTSKGMQLKDIVSVV